MVTTHLRSLFLVCLFSLTSIIASSQPEKKTIRITREPAPASTSSIGKRFILSYNLLQFSEGILPVYLEYEFAKSKTFGIMVSSTNTFLGINPRSPGNLISIPIGESASISDFQERYLGSDYSKWGYGLGATFNYYFDNDDLPSPGKFSLEYRHRRFNYEYFDTWNTNPTYYKLQDKFNDIVATISYIPDWGPSLYCELYVGAGLSFATNQLANLVSAGNIDLPSIVVPFDNSETHFIVPIGFRFMHLIEVDQKAKSSK